MSNETSLATQQPRGALEAINNHDRYLQSKKNAITRWVTGGVSPEALIRFTLHDLQNNEKLRECEPISIYMALLACAVSGLEPGPLKAEAFLVPRSVKFIVDGKEQWRQECQFMLGWRGVQKQAHRAGIDIHSNVVHAQDDFSINLGTNQELHHRPALTAPGEIIGAYAWCKLPRGGLEIEWLNRIELEAIERSSGGRSPAWKSYWGEMARKSAVKRIGKRLPMGDDFFKASRLDSAAEIGADTSAMLDAFTEGDAMRGAAHEFVQSVAFSDGDGEPRAAAAAPPAKSGSKSKPIEAKSTERPTNPPTSSTGAAPGPGTAPTSSHSAKPSTDGGSKAPAAPSSPSSKLEEAKAAVEAKRPTTPTPAATPAPSSESSPPVAPSSSTESVSTTPATATSSSASPGEFSEDFATSDAPVVPAAKSLEAFAAWLASCGAQDELDAGKLEWLVWCRNTFVEGGTESKVMQKSYAARKAELPPTRAG